ncbi:MAG: multiheme c-type cytochrome, partial [Terriglobales bacterium]
MVALYASGVAAGNPKSAGPKYHDEVKKKYDYRFGANPWLPSQAKNESGEFTSAKDFPTAAYCAKCHEDAHRQWRESAHSNSFRAPFYKRNVDILNNTKGIEFSRHCEGCHNPTALFSGSLSKGSKLDRSFDEDGVTCMNCHSIQSIQNTSGIGSYVMGTPAVMVDESGKPVPGLASFDEILANPKRHGAAVMKDFYRTSEFCAVCHKAAVPKQLNDYKWLRAFSVYDEWQNSSYAKESPLPFYTKDVVSTCQTCHMKAFPVENDYGAKAGQLKSHRWLGAHTAIPIFYGFDEQLKQTIQFLKDDLLNVDIFAMTRGDSGELIAPLDKQGFTLTPGEDLTVSVYIQNKGIGHSLVPEQRDFYESWVEFKVTDAAGKVITHSGFLKPDNYLDDRAHVYINRIVGREGKFLDLHQVWLTRIRAFDSTILPGRSDLVRYRFTLPDGLQGPIEVSAKVNYRRFRQGWVDYVLQKKGVMYPVVLMAGKSLKLNLGENPGSTEPADQKEMLRWNNYGIALLGQQQYAKAAAAFTRVVEINPKYVEGYVNIAVAQYSYEKYGAAMVHLEKALTMRPGDPRAVYFHASI